MILLLNEKDKFKTKIEKYPLTVCFSDYEGLNTYDATSSYIQTKFEETNKYPIRKIYTRFVSHHDTQGIRLAVLESAQHIIINRSLDQSGLI